MADNERHARLRLQALAPFTNGGELMSLDQLPTGEWITTSWPTQELQVQGADGQVARRFWPLLRNVPRCVRVSPDGTKLAITHYDEDSEQEIVRIVGASGDELARHDGFDRALLGPGWIVLQGTDRVEVVMGDGERRSLLCAAGHSG